MGIGYNKWTGKLPGDDVAGWGSYKTDKLIFTKNYIGKYYSGSNYSKDTGTKIGVGYANFNYKDKAGFDINSNYNRVIKWMKELKYNYVNNVKVVDNPDVFGSTPLYIYNYENADNPTVETLLSDAAFEKYNSNIISSGGTINIGTSTIFSKLLSSSLTVKSGYNYVVPVSNEKYVSGVVDYNVLRQSLYTSSSEIINKKPDGSHDKYTIYYITDIVIDPKTTEGLIEYKKNNSEKNIYVSTIPYTLAGDGQDSKFYMLTPRCVVAC